jgi:hypothetical protein
MDGARRAGRKLGELWHFRQVLSMAKSDRRDRGRDDAMLTNEQFFDATVSSCTEAYAPLARPTDMDDRADDGEAAAESALAPRRGRIMVIGFRVIRI